ncbi:hypothetical protein [Alicyclobacillus fastidiosus]|uniref:hypothetical protein n=1 Tax=Alicyclobacillus fastidiosus TaxID=392011 RepID=UPI0023E9B960|nr:hypothetical protein [Alicyclobacillus fastidiosus]GMA66220.1 hypothetical protein GCM10025859_66620 [Alicyclobacillus fastidiosus]GMA66253.1 hypothetical protein GCM10025859_66950 [Alicyclobacillus fastidiosus]
MAGMKSLFIKWNDYIEFNESWIRYRDYKCPPHQAALYDANIDSPLIIAELGKEYVLRDVKAGYVICTIPFNVYNTKEFVELERLLHTSTLPDAL